MTDEQIAKIEEETRFASTGAKKNIPLLIAEIRTLQQQNKQMKEVLEWIDEYRELNMTIAMNEWEEAAAFKAVENRVTVTLQSLQGGTSNAVGS